MKLFSLRLTTLKSKLYAIVFASFVVRVVAFFSLPNTASNLGPDEGNYANLIEWVGQGEPVSDYPQFGPNLYYSSRAIILPATLLHQLGMDSLLSMRFVSSTYGLLLATLVCTILIQIDNRRINRGKFSPQEGKVISGLFAVFVFLPSHFFWSTVGLRESAVEFWTISTFWVFFWILNLEKKVTLAKASLLLLCVIMVFSSRPQVGLILGASLLIYLIAKIKNKTSLFLLPVTLSAIFVGSLLCTTPKTPTTPTTPTTPITPFKVNFIDNIVSQTKNLTSHHEANQAGAESVIATASCPLTQNSTFNELFCLAWKSPYSTFTFLFRPVLGVDVTSTSSLLAAAENILWLASFLFIMVVYIRNKKLAFIAAIAPSLLFASIYSIAAGAYEGNMGTAFRHKSLILWVVLLLIASTIVATQQRKAEQQGIPAASQE